MTQPTRLPVNPARFNLALLAELSVLHPRLALGWSAGTHGLRHSYAQDRINELTGRGYSNTAAKEEVSQELGHFRADVTDVYLR